MRINYIKAAKTNFRQIFQQKYEGFDLSLHMFGTLLSLIRLFTEPKMTFKSCSTEKNVTQICLI